MQKSPFDLILNVLNMFSEFLCLFSIIPTLPYIWFQKDFNATNKIYITRNPVFLCVCVCALGCVGACTYWRKQESVLLGFYYFSRNLLP